MITYTKPLSKLIGHFEKFPGIGPRTAQRLALFILKQPESTIKNADNILVVDKGKIVESGKHEELLDRDKIYSDLWNVQVGI